MYSASSSRRACTLRLPSVVLSSALSSLKLRLSFTARALTIPRRIRSWISRSRSAAPTFGSTGASADGSASRVRSRAAVALATVAPRDDDAEDDVEPSEARAEQGVPPRGGSEEGQRAEHQEAESHRG